MARYALLFVLAVALVALALFIAGQMGMLRGTAPGDLGVKDGKLKRPSLTENSVSSQADLWPDHPRRAYASIVPLKMTGDGSREMSQLLAMLGSMRGTVIVQQDPDYVYAQSTTRLLKFTDDLEFYFDRPAGLIHLRSASRLGQKDFGANRARIELIRQAMSQ